MNCLLSIFSELCSFGPLLFYFLSRRNNPCFVYFTENVYLMHLDLQSKPLYK